MLEFREQLCNIIRNKSLQKYMCKTVPPIVENLEEERQRKMARTRESRQTLGRPKKFKRESGTDRHYGPQAQKLGVTPDVFERLR